MRRAISCNEHGAVGRTNAPRDCGSLFVERAGDPLPPDALLTRDPLWTTTEERRAGATRDASRSPRIAALWPTSRSTVVPHPNGEPASEGWPIGRGWLPRPRGHIVQAGPWGQPRRTGVSSTLRHSEASGSTRPVVRRAVIGWTATAAVRTDRELHTWVEDDGMVVVRGRLTPEAGSAFRRALEAAVEADRAAAGVAGADGTRAAGGGCPSGPERQPSNRKMATTAPTITPACRSIARKPSARSELIAPCSVATSARSVSGGHVLTVLGCLADGVRQHLGTPPDTLPLGSQRAQRPR